VAFPQAQKGIRRVGQQALIPQKVPGSYRDPRGQVYRFEGRILRSIHRSAADDYGAAQSIGLLDDAVGRGFLLPTTDVGAEFSALLEAGAAYILEHPVVPFISHPFEWPFSLLRMAALHHLDFHIYLLDRAFTLSDATAYNVQFVGVQPVFIDLLSIRRYVDGEYWLGHAQFMEQFVLPLLLQSATGVPYNDWYRGSLSGIPMHAAAKLLPWRKKLTPRALVNVVLPTILQKRVGKSFADVPAKPRKPLPKPALLAMLRQLRAWVDDLRPPDVNTLWSDYECSNTYAQTEAEAKRAFVMRCVQHESPDVVWDIGCNSGYFSEAALAAGAARVIGFDADLGALEQAVRRAQIKKLEFLPLYLDACNPSPNQGWLSREREGLDSRRNADVVLALALVHHLIIGRNIPLDQVVNWIVSLAPAGVIEWVEKTDPTVVKMLRLREDIFISYNRGEFERALSRVAQIRESTEVAQTGRMLYWFERPRG
jgi:ribosomal protein L11 methylase PrmA